MNKQSKIIGFIGQGWIGKHYADNFEERGYTVIRYSLEEPYIKNRDKISECDIVFIAVPTPTNPEGFNDSIVREAIKLVGEGKIAVIKSTILPGTTESIQKENPRIYVLHSPEFLREASAAYDTANPTRNIVGIPIDNEEYQKKAKLVMSILPKAPHNIICKACEAELIKYGSNCMLYLKVIYANILYDCARKLKCDWKKVKAGIATDPRIGESHLEPIHQSGRGAGGHCFIKDFAAFVQMYKKITSDELGSKVLGALENKNIDLLINSNKDLDLLTGVYGEEVIKKFKNLN